MLDSTVWLPLLTLAAGYAGSLLTESIRDRRTRERDDRLAELARRQAREDKQAEFQRGTLLELQDALSRLIRTTAEIDHHDTMVERQTGKWRSTQVAEDVNQRNFKARVDTTTLAVRVADDELRGLVDEILSETADSATARTREDAAYALNQAVDVFGIANGRLGEVLRGL
jgi:hypothetical protein